MKTIIEEQKKTPLFCHMLDYGKPYLLFGKLDSNWGALTLTVEKTQPIHFLTEKTNNGRQDAKTCSI